MKLILRISITMLMGLIAATLAPVSYANEAVTFKASGESPIVTFTQRHDRVRGVERSAELIIRADGRVNVHRPSYMVDPGNWEYRLSAKQLHALLRQFSINGLIDFDAAKAGAERNAAEQIQRINGMRYAIGDSTFTTITLSLSDFSINGAKSRSVDQRIVWTDIGEEARRYRSVNALQGLAAAEKSLIQLLNPRHRNAQRATGDK